MNLKRLRYYLRDGRGDAAIELAIVLPLFLLFIFGILQLGYIMWGYISLEYALSYTARYAFVHPTSTSAQLKNYAASTIGLGSAITFSANVSSVSADITGTFSFTPFYLPINPVKITTTVHQVLPSS